MDLESIFYVVFFSLVMPMSWMFGVTYFKKWKQQQDHAALGGEAEEQILRLQERLAELEERVDFTERLLARGPDRVDSAGER